MASEGIKSVLVAGISGSGKSAVAEELERQGYRSIDADSVPYLAHWEDEQGHRVERPARPSAGWLDHHFWQWDSDHIDRLLQTPPYPIFVCGAASNQGDFLDRFDRVVLLEVDKETMLRRLADPERENDFGAGPGAREALLSWLDGFQEDLRSRGAVVVDATRPLAAVVSGVLAVAELTQGGSAEKASSE